MPGKRTFFAPACPGGEFRAVQRERTRAAVEYIRNTAHNAACLLRLGEAASRSADPRIAEAGRRLIDSALRLRAYALLSNTRLYVRLAFPESRLSYGQLADNYQASQRFSGSTRAHAVSHPGDSSFDLALRNGKSLF